MRFLKPISSLKWVLGICWLMTGVTTSLCCFAQAKTKETTAPEIYFSPRQEAVNPGGKGINYNTYDFPQMIADPEAWKTAASRMSGIDLGLMHIVEHYQDVESVIGWLDRLKMRVAGGGSVLFTNGDCTAPAMEGVSGDRDFEREIVLNLSAWHRAGGRLDDLVLDSPFFFGYYQLRRYCNFSIKVVAERAAATVNRILWDFPNARIIDAEGPGPIKVPIFLADYAQFVQAFNAVSRKPIDRLSMDMHYTDAWHTGYRWVPSTRTIAEWAHQVGLKAGFLMDAEDQFVQSADGSIVTREPITATSWMQMVRAHMLLAKDENLPLDYIEIVSWMKFPDHNLPESDSLAFTSLVNDAYAIWHEGDRQR